MDEALCFHCGLPVPAGSEFVTTVGGEAKRMCCPGCVAVADLILGSGLEQYYRYRDLPAPTPGDKSAAELAHYDRPAVRKLFARCQGGHSYSITLSVEGLRCAACVWLIEQHLQRQPGVVDVAVSLTANRAELTWDETVTHLSTLLAAIARLGYRAHPYRPEAQEAARQTEHRDALKRLAVAGLGMMQVMMFAVGLYAGAIQGMADSHRDFLRWVSAIIAAPVVGYAALPFFAAAGRDLMNRRAGMDLPIALAIAGTYVASLAAAFLHRGDVYFESISMFVFLIALGRFLEMRARHHAARCIEGALRPTPKWALRLRDGGDETVSVYELEVGDRVLVKPGATFPADGCVIGGHGWVNEAMLTGEEWPRAKHPGDMVTGGTQNGESPLTMRVDHLGADTKLSGIVRLVDRAARERPPIAQLADRVARVFVPRLLLLATVVGAVWCYIDPSRALWVTLSVLVISCPCALSLATPAALAAATGHLLHRGLLVTRAHVLEGLARATDIVFDKTGTLTRGQFRLEAIVPLGTSTPAQCLALARQLERHSEHPIARAFAAAEENEPERQVTAVRAVAGCGIEARVDGDLVRIGERSWVEELAACPGSEDDGHGVLLGTAAGPLCWFELRDEARPAARYILQKLTALGLRLHVVSGDDAGAVESLAADLGVPHLLGRAKPEDKLHYVRRLQASGAVVVMVGDGVNDSPSLGGAQVSIALGGGTDLAMTAADSVLLRDDLEVLVEAISTSRRTRTIIAQNIAWALAYNLIAVPLAACGLVAPYGAALGMSLSSLIVVGNALRLGRPQAARVPKTSTPGWRAVPVAGPA